MVSAAVWPVPVPKILSNFHVVVSLIVQESHSFIWLAQSAAKQPFSLLDGSEACMPVSIGFPRDDKEHVKSEHVPASSDRAGLLWKL